MGNNSSQNQNPLTHNWQLIAPKLYRNLITQELIQEQILSFTTPEEQAYFIAQLKKRMTHHHPHVLKIIYFKTENDNCNCSFDSKKFNVLIYMQEKGRSLQQHLRQKTLNSATICSCLHILNSLEYLQNIYGSFQVSQRLIFINQKKQLADQERPIKIWISSHTEDFRRERPCSQESMCLTILQTLKKLVENGQCSVLSKLQLKQFENITYLKQLRDEIGKLHNNKNLIGNRHKKSISLALQPNNNKNITNSSTRVDFIQEGKRSVVKTCSMPQKTEDNFKNMNKTSESPEAFHKNREFIQNVLIYKEAPLRKTTNDSKLIVNNFINSKPQKFGLPLNPAKINFNYSINQKTNNNISLQLPYKKNIKDQPQTSQYQYIQTQVNSNTQPIPLKIINRPTYHPRPNIIVQPMPSHSNSFSNNYLIEQQQNRIVPNTLRMISQTNNNFVVSHQVSSTNSINSSLLNSKKDLQTNFIGREMELPLKQAEKDSPETGKLPTTSRSPQKQRQTVDIEPIYEVIELQTSNNQNQKKTRNGRNSRNGKMSSAQNSSNKFEKYSQAIKQYQQKLKKRISEKGKQKSIPILTISDKSAAPPSSDFKQTKSVYNESSNDEAIQDDINIVLNGKINLKRKSTQRLNKQKRQLQQKLNKQQEQERMIYEERVRRQQQQLWRRQKKQEEEIRLRREEQQRWNKEKEQQKKFKDREEEMLKQIKEQERKTRQKLEKIQLEKDLEKEKKLIQNEMEDLLRHNAMKEQYRSIRQKVKQKKQTFAELKAQATKILQDLDY